MAEYSQEAFEEGRAYAKAHPAPEHIVAVVNRALRAPRTGERGDPDAQVPAAARARLVEVAR